MRRYDTSSLVTVVRWPALRLIAEPNAKLTRTFHGALVWQQFEVMQVPAEIFVVSYTLRASERGKLFYVTTAAIESA